ncbi:SEN1 N terminal-domain-containing protein [Mycena amicta]|nr:SEN1 N terminal-domain-containing protein [Mycena amicta]
MSHDIQRIDDTLKELRDFPVDSSGDDKLALLYNYLCDIPPQAGRLHWFCRRATSTTVEAASFLLRLHAYSSEPVLQWKGKMAACLKGCVECVAGLQRAKAASKNTYFGAFPEGIIHNFFASFEEWEASHVLESVGGDSFASSSPALCYHAVANLAVLDNPRVMTILRQRPPTSSFESWPSDPVPPGVLILLMNEESRVRKWAEMQASQATVSPVDAEQFSTLHTKALEIMTTALNLETPRQYGISSDLRVLWSAFSAALKFIPEPQLDEIYELVLGHLHDTGPEFPLILSCFKFLTATIGSRFWKGQAPEYPQVIFDSIKDNTALEQLLLRDAPPSNDHPSLSWCLVFLAAIDGHPAQDEIVAKMADFLCEELQHERFGAARPGSMFTAIKMLSKFSRTNIRGISKVLDIHADTILAVAFSSSHSAAPWATARTAACRLLKLVVGTDVQFLLGDVVLAFKTAKHIEKTAKQYDNPEPQLIAGPRIWSGLYRSLVPGNDDGVALVLEVLARAAHLDHLAPQFFKLKRTEDLAINRCLSALWDGLSEGLARYIQNNRPQALVELLQRPGVAQHVFTLLFSPREDIQLSAESLVMLAFDVDGRQDCYRVLLQKYSDAAFEALLGVLTRFNEYVEGATEASSLGRHLVCYMQDIMDVLFSRQSGLVHIASFLQPDSPDGLYLQLPELWLRINRALSLLFKHAPSWAAKFEADEMVDWMRDALLLGREVFSQFRTFETLANSRSPHRSGSLSETGGKLMEGLQIVLPELSIWLRLSDTELLHQMFELLDFLLKIFTEVNVQPKPASMARMQKYIDAASDSKKTRLDATRLLRLENDLAALANPPPQTRAPESKLEKHRKPATVVQIPRPSALRDQRTSDGRKPSGLPSTSRRPPDAPSTTSRRPSEAPTVSSGVADEGSSSDDEPDPTGRGALATLAYMQRSPKINKKLVKPTRQVQLYDGPMQTNPIQDRLERRAQEARKKQRMMPDISDLYKSILSWDHNHSGNRPPVPLDLVPVPADMFVDYEHYRRVFYPLLLLECWEQIVQSKLEPGTSYPFKINSRAFSDDWIIVDLTFDGSVQKDWRLTEQDIVVLQRSNTSILAKVESCKTPTGKAIELAVKCLASLDPGLVLNSEWRVSSVFSLSTATREYSALLGLRFYDICPAILRPSLPPIRAPRKDMVQKVMTRHRVNEPQATAISSCLETPGFSLIQGPPGTGKTSTIVALVKSHLERRSQRIAIPGKNKNSKPDAPEPQILICAPSNAAVDEIAQRIRDSDVFKNEGKSLVRLGPLKSMNPNIIDVSLEQMMDAKLDSGKDTGAAAEITSLRAEIEAVKTQRQQKLAEMDSINDNSARVTILQDEISRLNSKRTSLSKKLDEVKDNRIKMTRGLDSRRRALRLEILQNAHVICATLSTSGSDYLRDLEIDMVIIDEASQAIELSALIPLKYQPKYTILVGDPQQLPPTVISEEARKLRYNESLFVRLQNTCPNSMHLLSIQYRMHPAISLLPSTLFYQSRLADGPEMDKKTRQPWHDHPKFGIYRFMNVKSVEDKTGRSLKNITECRIAVALFSRLRRSFPSIDFDGKVGVISMYRAQIVELKRHFIQEFGTDVTQTVDFNTVDGFQGQEKSIIILSCVRAGPSQETIGFLSDVRRMNVALTRAKSSLFVLGNGPTLSRSNDVWKRIIADARTRNAYVDVDTAYFTAPDTVAQRIASPTKAKVLAPPPTLPADLATPRDLKNIIDRRASLTALQSQPVASGSGSIPHPPSVQNGTLKRKSEREEGPSAKKLNTRDPPASLTTLPPPGGSNLKRRIESEDGPPAKKQNFKPRPPRPKDAAASMFIPKKKPPPR